MEKYIIDPDVEYDCSPLTKSVGFTKLMLLASKARELNDDNAIKNYINENMHELNAQNDKGWTALMIACRNSATVSTESIVKILIDAGADLNLQEKEGCTALMLAC